MPYRSGHPGPGGYLGRQMSHRMANRMTAEAAVWHAMFVEQIPLTEKILRTVIVYALIAVLFRLTGKRGLASMNTFDVIVIFLLSNVVQNAVIGNDTSLTGGVIGAVTLVTVNAAVNRVIASSTTAARIFDGRATTVISDGHAIDRRCGAWACGAANSTSRCAFKTATTSRRS